jgi:hypothetical protein
MVLFTVSLLALLTEARAEIYAIPVDFGWRKSIPLQFIGEESVIEDLGLSPDVVRRLNNLQAQIQMEVEAERRKAPNDRSNVRNKGERRYPWDDELLHIVRNRHNDELNELLTSEQQTRLHQIQLQRLPNRTDALSDSGVAKELGLTDTQRSQIYAIHNAIQFAEVHRKNPELLRNNPDVRGKRWSELFSESPAKILNVLSDKQREAFVKLQGAPQKSTDSRRHQGP